MINYKEKGNILPSPAQPSSQPFLHPLMHFLLLFIYLHKNILIV